ncbi:hypothetical protein OTU49_014043, partial [Cherax quadricarinatus]
TSLYISSTVSAKMLLTHSKIIKVQLKQILKTVKGSVVRGLHTTSIYTSSVQDDYRYIHRSKIPTMHFQKSLLRLPIPDLDKTCTRYLRSQKALLSDEEYSATKRAVDQFKEGSGMDLHAQLKQKDKANKHTSYISDPWFDMYLSDRVPVVLNYNPFMAFHPEERPGYSDPVIRATNTLVSSLRYMCTLRDSVLEPVVYHLNPAKSDNQRFRNIMRWMP